MLEPPLSLHRDLQFRAYLVATEPTFVSGILVMVSFYMFSKKQGYLEIRVEFRGSKGRIR